MRTKARLGILTAAICAATASLAQDDTPTAPPLNIIEWLDEQAITPTALPSNEPDVADTGTVPDVTVRPLGTPAPKRVGLAAPNVTGLPDTLWSGSDGTALATAVAQMPDARVPALQSLLFTLL